METIISSLISGGVAIIVCLLTQQAAAKKTEAVITYRLDELTREVREHNNFARRVPLVEQQITNLERRLDALERSME